MSVRSRLNGYTVPTAIMAVIVSLLGLALMQSCTAAKAQEIETARLKMALDSHLAWSSERNSVLAQVDARTQNIEKDVVLIRARQEEILRLLRRDE